MKNDNTFMEMLKTRRALISVGANLFTDRLTYGDNTAHFEERITELLKEYDKIIDDYKNSDGCLIEDEEEW